MKIIQQLGVIFLVCLAGEGISMALPFSCPGGIVSMVLMFLLLTVGAIREERLRECVDFLLENMAFFYIPVSVGLLEYGGLLQKYLVVILLICFLSFLLTLAVTYYTVVFVERLMKRRK